ncbi:hypothetical protein ACOI1H_23855 [Loktanella sp. DJP18]|uniref:hypothetical protein n=1 Tax=Loktanella sp. DJP18 TaxID=3409788 RepID=UPI003BB4D577
MRKDPHRLLPMFQDTNDMMHITIQAASDTIAAKSSTIFAKIFQDHQENSSIQASLEVLSARLPWQPRGLSDPFLLAGL